MGMGGEWWMEDHEGSCPGDLHGYTRIRKYFCKHNAVKYTDPGFACINIK